MQNILKGAVPFEKLHKKWMKDPKYKEAYDDLDLNFQMINLMYRRVAEKKLAWKKVGAQLGFSTYALRKLERAEFDPSVKFLKNFAKKMDVKLTITLS